MRLETQALDAGASQDDGVVLARIQFRQARIYVTPQIQQLQIRAARTQLRLATQ